MKNLTKDGFSLKSALLFIIPSLLGIILFIIPINFNGEITIPVAILSKFLAKALGDYLTSIITIAICISATMSILTKIFKPKFIVNNEFLNTLFNVGTIWFIARIIGAVFCILALFKVGPEAIINESTGSFVLNDYVFS